MQPQWNRFDDSFTHFRLLSSIFFLRYDLPKYIIIRAEILFGFIIFLLASSFTILTGIMLYQRTDK